MEAQVSEMQIDSNEWKQSGSEWREDRSID